MNCDVLILGGGPAGLSAGIYAGRAGVKTVIIEKNYVGGQATDTFEIENYPGFTSVSGFELTQNMSKQAEECGAEIIYGEIAEISLKDKIITLTNGEQIQAKAIIIATGAKHTPLGIDGEQELKGRGVSYCATCDGAFYKGKRVLVVGGGNTAVADAVYLKNFALSVTVIHRRVEFRATQASLNKLYGIDVTIKTPYSITALNSEEGKFTGVTVKNNETGIEENIQADGLFVAIGQTPDTKVFDEVTKDEKGYIVTDEDMKTNIEGVFCAGDCRQKYLRQIITACSDGAIAAERAVEYILK